MAARAVDAAHSADGSAVLCVAAVGCVVGLLAIAFVVWSRHATPRWLRRCPVCDEDAVQATEAYAVDVIQVLVRLQCGQCGIWRRALTTRTDLAMLARRLERDRRTISACAVRLTRRRTREDFRSFMHVLREQISGADDFVALTRPCRRASGRS